ncbi:CBS domain-containing protein [Pelagibacterium montanilacus]|uniref:CBS domain-containing protein n=1 Tax=Pelagibacterium montanilacus TaxID=2185280 RepID=UPI000F8C4AF4|nr:CBS domain-containing protein [Pelagibacterium montanilacus]
MTQITDIVGEARSLRSDDTLRSLMEALRTSPQTVFPVLDDKERVVGTVSELDLVRLLDPSEPTLSFGPGKLIRAGLVSDVEDIMTRRPTTISIDEPLHAAAKKMETMRLPQLIVVDKDKRLKGLLRGRDVFLALFEDQGDE